MYFHSYTIFQLPMRILLQDYTYLSRLGWCYKATFFDFFWAKTVSATVTKTNEMGHQATQCFKIELNNRSILSHGANRTKSTMSSFSMMAM